MGIHRTTLAASLRELNPGLFTSLRERDGIAMFITGHEQALLNAVEQLEETLHTAHPAPEDYLARVRHFNAIRHQAEEICLHEAIETLRRASE